MELEHSDISRMLEVGVVAARLAGQRAMEDIKYTKTKVKNDNELVTESDATCQKLIIDRIKETYPDHGFMAEEGSDGNIFKQPPRGEPIWWVIDPIDGTTNYAHGLLNFAVSIAVMHESRPIAGVIFDPATDSMYTAAKDMDAQLNYSHITVGNDSINRFSMFGITGHIPSEQMDKVYRIMLNMKLRNLGTTALHLGYVARGALIGTKTNASRLWDIAAGAALVESAGGRITDMQGNDVFPIDMENYDGGIIEVLATNKKTHNEFLGIFQS